MATERFLLAGSAREPRADARITGTANPADVIEVSVLVRRPAEPDVAAAHDEPITREEFALRYAASPDDVERIEAFAQQFELTVVGVDLPSTHDYPRRNSGLAERSLRHDAETL